MRQLKIQKSITNRSSEALDKYLVEIGRAPLISIDEEIELAQKILEKVRRKHITSRTNNETNKENEKSKEHHLYSTISSENVEIRLYGDY